MIWKLIDIHQTPTVPQNSYAVLGQWQHANNVDKIMLYNGMSFDFSIKHAPCQLTGATRIAKGASGKYERSSLPWTERLNRALEALQCEHTAVALMDCPPDEHVYSAIAALQERREEIEALRDTNKLLAISGRPDHKVPKYKLDGITYSTENWATIQSYFHMTIETPLLMNTQGALAGPLALLLGSYQHAMGPSIVKLDLPAGCTIPREVLSFIQYSSNVTHPRVSCSDGILLHATDTNKVVAKVIVATEENGCETEDPVLRLVRNSFSKDAATAGSAYFQLREIDNTSPCYNVALCAVRHVEQRLSKNGAAHKQTVPISRALSCGVETTKWL